MVRKIKTYSPKLWLFMVMNPIVESVKKSANKNKSTRNVFFSFTKPAICLLLIIRFKAKFTINSYNWRWTGSQPISEIQGTVPRYPPCRLPRRPPQGRSVDFCWMGGKVVELWQKTMCQTCQVGGFSPPIWKIWSSNWIISADIWPNYNISPTWISLK